jgi:hypothetical protein
MDSIPVENLKRESVTLIHSRSDRTIFAWEVSAGEQIVDSTPPRLTAGLITFNRVTNLCASLLLSSNDNMAPKSIIYAFSMT